VLTFVVDEVKQLIFLRGPPQAGAILLQGHGRFVTDCWGSRAGRLIRILKKLRASKPVSRPNANAVAVNRVATGLTPALTMAPGFQPNSGLRILLGIEFLIASMEAMWTRHLRG